jgi:hypothetical protein
MDVSSAADRFRAARDIRDAQREAVATTRAADFERGRADGFRWARDIAEDLDAVDTIARMDPLRVRLAMVWRVGRQDPIRDAAVAAGALGDVKAPLPEGYADGFYVGARPLRSEVAALV